MEELKKEIEDYFCRFTFGQFVTLILLEIVTLFFVFYLGAHYGPDLLGKREAKKGTDLPKEGKSVDEIVGTPPVEYTYPEVLTGPAGQKAIKVKPSGLTAEEYERRGKELAKSEEKVEGPSEETAVVGGEEVPPIQEIKTKQQPEKKATAGGSQGKFSIQVGSYQSAEEANAALTRWKKRGYSAFMTIGQIPDKGTWYRVRIGGFPTRQEAETYLEKFKTKEKTAGLVVPSKS
jgi:cell division septation protein DedD